VDFRASGQFGEAKNLLAQLRFQLWIIQQVL